MKACVYEEYGEADVLQVKTDVPVTAPKATQVVIKTFAAGINPVAWKLRKGYIKGWPQQLPMIPGWDISGTIVAVGDEVKNGLQVGDEVFSYNRPAFDMKESHPESAEEKMEMNGCCAEYVTAESWKVAKKPASVSLSVAGSIPLAGLTAYQGLMDHGKLTEGQTVLILNASGGVGSYAVGIAKAHGATVIGSCSGRSAEYVKSLGADAIVDYTQGSIAEQAAAWCQENGKQIDLCFDCVGGDNTKEGVTALKDGGKIISIANGGALADLCAAKENGSATGAGFLVQPSTDQLDELGRLIDSGKVKVSKVTEMPLDEIVEAHKASETGRTHGKIVVLM